MWITNRALFLRSRKCHNHTIYRVCLQFMTSNGSQYETIEGSSEAPINDVFTLNLERLEGLFLAAI